MSTAFSNISKSYNYNEYSNLVTLCADKNITTGKEQLPERINATKLNAQRMNRIFRQVEINERLKHLIQEIPKKVRWIVLAESWCGDGAQNIPILAKIASLSDNISFKIILRDENPTVMDTCLTNGSRSIPKLICISGETGIVLGTWGPRPFKIQQMVKEYKLHNPNEPHDTFLKNLHKWYAQDKGESLQHDFEQLLVDWYKTNSKSKIIG